LRSLIAILIDKETMERPSADVQGDIYEVLLEKNEQDTSPAPAILHPRVLIDHACSHAPTAGTTSSIPPRVPAVFSSPAAGHILKNYKLDAQVRHRDALALCGSKLVSVYARPLRHNLPPAQPWE